MYCKKCGRELGNDDRFCSSCGAPVTKEDVIAADAAEDSAANAKISKDTSEFVWNVHDFKTQRKVENVTVDWEKGTVIEIADPVETENACDSAASLTADTDAAVKSEFVEEHEEQRENDEASAKADNIDVEMCHDSCAVVQEVSEISEEDVPVTIDDIEADIKRDEEMQNPNLRRDTARLDRFYTLNKQNEEFQKLLDMEYERIKAGREGSYIVPGAFNSQGQTPDAESVAADTEISTADTANEAAAEAAVSETVNSEPFNPVEHLKKAEEERNAALGLGADLSRMAEDYEIQKLNNVYYDENGEEMRIFDTMELEKDLIEAAVPSVSTKTNNEIITEISDKIASTKENVEKTYSSLLDEIFGQITAAGAGTAQAEEVKLPNESPKTQTQTETFENEEDTMPIKEDEADNVSESYGASVTETGERTVVHESEKSTEFSDVFDSEPAVASFYKGESERTEYKKKSPIGKIILMTVIIILIAECAVLGIQHFMSDSKAAEVIDNSLKKVVMLFNGDADDGGGNADKDKTDNDDGGATDADNEDEENQDDSSNIPDRSVPEADLSAVLTAILTEQQGINENIANITYDAAVKYDENHKYNSTLVSQTMPLESNVLYTDADSTVHYVDEEVLKTLIAYNSGWIDYVNNSSNTIFKVLKNGSDAWNNTKAFNASGITKEFVSLSIGEIRAGEQGEYFVWAKEVIKTTKDSKTTTDEYNWVYHMELTDGKLLIVDYYK